MSPLTADERARSIALLRDVACTHGSVRIILRRQLSELADRLETEPEPDAGDVVRAFRDEDVRPLWEAARDATSGKRHHRLVLDDALAAFPTPEEWRS